MLGVAHAEMNANSHMNPTRSPTLAQISALCSWLGNRVVLGVNSLTTSSSAVRLSPLPPMVEVADSEAVSALQKNKEGMESMPFFGSSP